MILRHLAVLSLACLLILSFSVSVSAAKPYIRSVAFSLDPLVLNKNFDIEVKVKNVDSSMKVQIFIDGETLPFREINVGAESEDVEISIPASDWSEDLRLASLTCGTHSFRADLVKSGLVYDSITKDFNVGTVPILRFDPVLPIAGKDIKIYVEDRETGDLIQNLGATISYSTSADEGEKYNTESAGFINFRTTDPGKYKFLITQKKEYCGEMYFYAKRNMLVDGPKPVNPTVGDMITIAVPSYRSSVPAARIYDSNGDLYLAAKTFLSGLINFTISDPGQYLIAIGEDDRYYWGVNKTINVSGRPSLSVTLEPDSPYVKNPVTVTVKAGSLPLANAKVKIITPEGVQREYSTLANGKVIYDGVSTMGEYLVVVESAKYEPVTQSFRAKKGFQISYDPEVVMLNEPVSIIVKDQDGVFVSDAEVSILDAQILGATDSEGRYTFTLRETNPDVDPGEYGILIKKDMFWDLNQKIKAQDTLEIVSSSDVEVENDVNVKVYNSRGGVVGDEESSVKITTPDNTITTLNKADFTFRPVLVGDYLIEASKNDYISTSETLYVRSHPLSVITMVDGRDLIVNVSSYNNSVSGISVLVGVSEGRVIKSLTTDIDGLARVGIESEGNVTITVNERDNNPLYEVKSTSKYIMKSYHSIPLIILFLVIIAGAVFIAYVIWYFRTLEHRRDKERFEARKGGSRLGNF